jgi:hypothetical protein
MQTHSTCESLPPHLRAQTDQGQGTYALLLHSGGCDGKKKERQYEKRSPAPLSAHSLSLSFVGRDHTDTHCCSD